MWYDFDIIKYAQYVLRPSLRKRKIFAIISIFLLPLIFIYTLFKSYRKQAINKLNINGQVIYIEKVLNDRFFLKNREIYITDIAEKNRTCITAGKSKSRPTCINGVKEWERNTSSSAVKGTIREITW